MYSSTHVAPHGHITWQPTFLIIFILSSHCLGLGKVICNGFLVKVRLSPLRYASVTRNACLSQTLSLPWPFALRLHIVYCYDLGHIILKIYAQYWRNLATYGNDVYNSGLATRNDLCFHKTNICAIWDCASCINTVRPVSVLHRKRFYRKTCQNFMWNLTNNVGRAISSKDGIKNFLFRRMRRPTKTNFFLFRRTTKSHVRRYLSNLI